MSPFTDPEVGVPRNQRFHQSLAAQHCLLLLQPGFPLGNTFSSMKTLISHPLPHTPAGAPPTLTLRLPLRLGIRSIKSLWRAKSKLEFLPCFLPPSSLYLFLEIPVVPTHLAPEKSQESFATLFKPLLKRSEPAPGS